MILVDSAVLSGRPDAAFLKTLARLRSLRAENNNLDVIDSALDHLALCCYLFDEALELAQQCEEGMDALVQLLSLGGQAQMSSHRLWSLLQPLHLRLQLACQRLDALM